MGISHRRLKVPANLESDPNANEVLSVWKLEDPITVLIKYGAWDDPAAWGLVLVDIARHVSKTYEQSHKMDKKAAFERIVEGINAELASPTDDF